MNSITIQAQCDSLKEILQVEGPITIVVTLERPYFVEEKTSSFYRPVHLAKIELHISKGQGDDSFFQTGKRYKIEFSEMK